MNPAYGQEDIKTHFRVILFLTVAIIASATLTLAQRIGVTYSADAQTSAALKNLSPDAQKVMERLSHLGSVPVDDVRYYAGSIPNGGAIDLDDSTWQTIKMPFVASADSVWLRKWVEVPKTFGGYDPTGAKIWLQEPTRGAVTVFCNGKRVSRGEDMEPIVLFGSAKPGGSNCQRPQDQSACAPWSCTLTLCRVARTRRCCTPSSYRRRFCCPRSPLGIL